MYQPRIKFLPSSPEQDEDPPKKKKKKKEPKPNHYTSSLPTNQFPSNFPIQVRHFFSTFSFFFHWAA